MKSFLLKLRSFFDKHFSFEEDIDLSNEVEVLFRRNVVIKNIILVSNLVYSSLLFAVTFGSTDPGSWMFTAIPLPITYLINKTIKKLVYTDTKSLISQQVAMYLSAGYMYLSAILMYMKLETGNDFLSQSGYMLIYYSLIVVSLYQDRVMLKRVFSWMLVIVTALHFLVTYQIYQKDYAASIFTFIAEFPKTNEFKDILFRTVIMGCFMLVVYAICVIGEKMGSSRKEELTKRQDIQNDFTGIVTNLFDVLINSRVTSEDDFESKLLSDITWKLASSCGFQPDKCTELAKYSLFLEEHQNDFKIEVSDSEDSFEILRNQSELGTQLVKRIELSQKTVNIIRTHIEGDGSLAFINKMNKIQKNTDSDIILLSDLYITLRSPKSYKRPYPHKAAIDFINTHFNVYFDATLLERFMRFQSDFEKIFDGE
ncbi:MAG: hypothetical protein R3Y05_06310 [bacterium]